jgi:hypothetical protein
MHLFRLSRYLKGELPSAPLDIAAISTLTSLYVTWQRAGAACEHLSISLRYGVSDRGVTLFGTVCGLVRMTAALLEVVRQQASRTPLVAGLRRDLLLAIGSWLTDARRELPIAAQHLCSAAGGSSDAVSSALRQLEQTLSGSPTAELPPGTPRRRAC